MICLALASFFLHLAFITRYGFFRDEFYYIACGAHLSFGYVDHPPLIAVIAAGTRWLLGDSLLAIRLPAAITAALIVFLTGVLTREMGGKRYAQVLAALCVMLAPVNLFIHHILSMNVFDHLFWVIAAIFVAKILKDPKPKYWIWLGIAWGLGLQNKISMLFFIFGFGVGLLLTFYNKIPFIGKLPGDICIQRKNFTFYFPNCSRYCDYFLFFICHSQFIISIF